jgi:AraC-like DNA-binding protein
VAVGQELRIASPCATAVSHESAINEEIALHSVQKLGQHFHGSLQFIAMEIVAGAVRVLPDIACHAGLLEKMRESFSEFRPQLRLFPTPPGVFFVAMNAHVSALPSDVILRNRQLVSRIAKSPLFLDYRSAFEMATGLPLTIRAAGSFQPPQAGSTHINPFCALMASQNKTCAACLELQQRAEQEAGEDTRTLECFAGLHDSVVAIRLGESVIAYLETGQVMFQPPTESNFRAVLKQLEQWQVVGDFEALETAYFHTRVIPQPNYEAALRLLGSFAEHLSLLCNELMMRTAAAEPVSVTKARTFIAEHLDDELSLTIVARAANMSGFYFCKVFKTAVGITFTDYVARARVEKTKQMLLDPNMRISEAAFAAGFQSLSQFNRVFRRITRESPSVYRDHLHDPGSRNPLALAG